MATPVSSLPHRPASQASSHPFKVSETRLKQIASDACTSALEKAEKYEHARMEELNGGIIVRPFPFLLTATATLTRRQNKILQSLISETKPSAEANSPWKFAVNSTIIQHLEDPRPQGTDGADKEKERKVGRRGMHSSAGAYWNNEKDGMWSFKWEGGEAKGMDVVVLVVWIHV
ncbi:Tctex-1-like protein [Elsinoe fawcettii]|nr:Tctex-1-like protein [Elsinoe fawcettii]